MQKKSSCVARVDTSLANKTRQLSYAIILCEQ